MTRQTSHAIQLAGIMGLVFPGGQPAIKFKTITSNGLLLSSDLIDTPSLHRLGTALMATGVVSFYEIEDNNLDTRRWRNLPGC